MCEIYFLYGFYSLLQSNFNCLLLQCDLKFNVFFFISLSNHPYKNSDTAENSDIHTLSYLIHFIISNKIKLSSNFKVEKQV